MKKDFFFKVEIDTFWIPDLARTFHPFQIYGPVGIKMDIHPDTRDWVKVGYVSIFCERKDIVHISKFPWFLSFESELPNDN